MSFRVVAVTPPDHAGQLSAGLGDDAFASDGLLTKRVLRAAALACLAPRAGELLWDLGAGSGSVAVEWCRLAVTNRAVAVERRSDRAARIGVNAARHGVAGQVEVVEAELEAVVGHLPPPDAVFVGGGVSEPLLRACWDALPRGGRIVVHSVTAESDALLLQAYGRHGGELTRVAVETAEPIGRFTGFRPARTVTAWAATRP